MEELLATSSMLMSFEGHSMHSDDNLPMCQKLLFLGQNGEVLSISVSKKHVANAFDLRLIEGT